MIGTGGPQEYNVPVKWRAKVTEEGEEVEMESGKHANGTEPGPVVSGMAASGGNLFPTGAINGGTCTTILYAQEKDQEDQVGQSAVP